jgi:hypothetical protein
VAIARAAMPMAATNTPTRNMVVPSLSKEITPKRSYRSERI